MVKDIFEDARRTAGCEYISDLKFLDQEIVSVLKRMKWEFYTGEEIKALKVSFSWSISTALSRNGMPSPKE